MSGPGQPSDLDRLIKESEEAIQRLDAIQKARHNTPLLERIRSHFARNKAHVSNVLLAGTVLAVALGKLGQKQEFEVGSLAWGGLFSPVVWSWEWRAAGCVHVLEMDMIGCQNHSTARCAFGHVVALVAVPRAIGGRP